jgi:hypothetical protein
MRRAERRGARGLRPAEARLRRKNALLDHAAGYATRWRRLTPVTSLSSVSKVRAERLPVSAASGF